MNRRREEREGLTTKGPLQKGLSSVEPEEDADELEGGEKRIGELVVTCGDCAKSLELAEESFDEVAFAIEREVGFTRLDAIGFGRNHRSNAPLVERLDQGVGVIRFVRKEGFRLDLFKQWSRLADIGGLARRQRNGDRIAERIDDDMDFGRQSAAGSANGLTRSVFFRAPALC